MNQGFIVFLVAEVELMSLDWDKINLIITFQDWKRFLTNIWILENKYYVTSIVEAYQNNYQNKNWIL